MYSNLDTLVDATDFDRNLWMTVVDAIRNRNPELGAVIDYIQKESDAASNRPLTFDDCRSVEQDIIQKLEGVYRG